LKCDTFEWAAWHEKRGHAAIGLDLTPVSAPSGLARILRAHRHDVPMQAANQAGALHRCVGAGLCPGKLGDFGIAQISMQQDVRRLVSHGGAPAAHSAWVREVCFGRLGQLPVEGDRRPSTRLKLREPENVVGQFGVLIELHAEVALNETFETRHRFADRRHQVGATEFILCDALNLVRPIPDSPAKKFIVMNLEDFGIPFIDAGVGVYRIDESLGGILRVATSTPEHRAHVWERQRIPFGDEEDDEYDRNIQTADLNMLNAVLAVIKWKKLYGFQVLVQRGRDPQGQLIEQLTYRGDSVEVVRLRPPTPSAVISVV
jgi:hypothetical protein